MRRSRVFSCHDDFLMAWLLFRLAMRCGERRRVDYVHLEVSRLDSLNKRAHHESCSDLRIGDIHSAHQNRVQCLCVPCQEAGIKLTPSSRLTPHGFTPRRRTQCQGQSIEKRPCLCAKKERAEGRKREGPGLEYD